MLVWRRTRRRDTVDNSPQQSESEGENADISSSGSESDLMQLIESTVALA